MRLGLTLTIALAVISLSPVIVFDNLGLARPSPSSSSSSQSSDPAPTPTAPSTISQDGGGDVTIQAPLQIPRTLQSNDLVNSLAFYEVTFITSTTGAIDKIRMDFPAGTGVGAAGIIERVGIGGGTLLKSGSSITYDLTTPVSIPAGTFIRLEMFGIKNPINPSTTFTADITTRDSGGNLIDGPSQTNVYTIKKVGSSDLADSSVTSTKPAESFMKVVTVHDDAAGHAVGWDPGGVQTGFEILEPEVLGEGTFISVQVLTIPAINRNCETLAYVPSEPTFFFECTSAPPNDAILHYTVQNLPSNIVS
ncbi:MAG: hypothetical protein ACRD47_07590 [Nitrososphaeraceae archaeon]